MSSPARSPSLCEVLLSTRQLVSLVLVLILLDFLAGHLFLGFAAFSLFSIPGIIILFILLRILGIL